MEKSRISRSLTAGASIFAVSTALLMAGSAAAQTAPPAEPATRAEVPGTDPEIQGKTSPTAATSPAADPIPAPVAPGANPAVNEITVTASRVSRAGFTAATPTIVAGSQQLEARATTNIGQFLQEIPAFKPSNQPSTNGLTQRSAGSNYVDLRGLGTSRTLVLVNGQRFVPETTAGLPGYQVNMNQIPALMVDRVEVVTGGASAQWGSDAVAGVVNIILKKKFTGLQAEAQGGISNRGDNESVRLGAVFGRNFAGDRGNITLAFDAEKQYGVGDVNTRDWGREHTFLLVNPCPNQVAVSANCPTGGNGQAVNLIVPDVQFSTLAPGGVITNTALRGTTFGPGGVSQQFVYGQYVGSTFMAGGGQPGLNFQRVQQIVAPYKRAETYGRFSYDLTENVTAYVEGSYAYSRGGGFASPFRSSNTIRNDNPFLPADLKARMAAANVTSFTLGRYNDQLRAKGDIKNETTRFVGGIDGRFDSAGKWKYAIAFGRGVNDYSQRVYRTGINQNMAFATDAILVNGQIVCRATVAGASFNAAAAGCVPVNPFGPTSLTDAMINYVSGTVTADITYKQSYANFQVSGEPFSTWAGPVSLAFGGEYRHESQVAVADAVANANGYAANNSSSLRGKFSVKEGFAELVVPLLKDSALGESLDLNGAVRYADYSGASGGQTTWKGGITYRPISGLLLRAARSRDIRAPNIYEQNVPAVGRFSVIRFGSTQPNVLGLIGGNPNLKPEKADTTTIGFSYQPPFVPRLAFSSDYYKIKTRGLVSSLSVQDSADLCLIAKEPSFCNLITYNSAGVPVSISTPFLNLATVDISGVDSQVSYRLPLSSFGASGSGSLIFSFASTYTIHSKVNSGAPGAVTIDRAGENGPKNEFSVPRFRLTSSIGYMDDAISFSVQARHVSSGNYDNTFDASLINNNRVAGRTYIDLSGSWIIRNGVTLFGVVNNLFDKDPPPAPTDNASPTNAAYYDVIGRSFKAGVRFKF